MRRDKRFWARVAVTALAFMLYASMAVRNYSYRQVIYAYQRLTETADSTEVERLERTIAQRVGTAHTPYDELPKRPRYIHFWDEYNNYGFIATTRNDY